MRHSFTAISAAVLFLPTLLLGCTPGAAESLQQATAASPSPSAPPATPSSFDATRAFGDMEKQVAFGPRVPTTPGHDQCRDWIIAELNKVSANPKRQDFTFTLTNGTVLPMSNITAQFNPEAKKQVMLCAHWDTRPTADQEIDADKKKKPIPGANDGASGVAVLLELARTFAAKKPDVGVELVFFDGEDYGPHVDRMFLGAKHYAKNPALPKPAYAILIDMIGDKDLSFKREANSEMVASDINDKVWNAAAALGHNKELAYGVGLEIQDDHLSLQEAGWKAIDLIDFDYPYWHTLDDTADKCSPASLKTIGDVLAKVVYDEK